MAVRVGLAAERVQLQHDYLQGAGLAKPWRPMLDYALISALPCAAAEQGVGHVQQQGIVAIVDHGPAYPDARTQKLSVGGFELEGVSISGQVGPSSADTTHARPGACAAMQGPRTHCMFADARLRA